jgi:hypothetical protein
VRFSSLDDVRVLHAADSEVPFEHVEFVNTVPIFLQSFVCLLAVFNAQYRCDSTLYSDLPALEEVGSVMTPSSWSVHMNSAKFPKPKHGPGGIGTIPCNLTGYSWSSHRGRHGV